MSVEELQEGKTYVRDNGTFDLAFIFLWLSLIERLDDFEARIAALEP